MSFKSSLINTSITHDPWLPADHPSNSTNLTNNYAPIEKQLTDSLLKRNTHPLARYTEDLPYYNDLFYNAEPLGALVKAQNARQKNKMIEIETDRVRLDTNPSRNYDIDKVTVTRKDGTVVTPKDETRMSKDEQNRNYLNPQLDILRQRERNAKYINDLMYVKSGLMDEVTRQMRTREELHNNYPYSSIGCTAQARESFALLTAGNASATIASASQRAERFTHLPRAAARKEAFAENDLPTRLDEERVVPMTIRSSERLRFTDVSSSGKEGFRPSKEDSYLDQVYIQSLESRLIAAVHYVNDNKVYSPWADNWKALEKSMKKVNYSFSRLDECDADIAFTVNKGEETKFRIRDKDRKYVPLNIYQYVVLHEAAHCANYGKWGHGKEFCSLLSLLCLAAYELGFVNLRNMQKNVYLTNGQPILCQSDMKNEILRGIELMISNQPNYADHYKQMAEHIRTR